MAHAELPQSSQHTGNVQDISRVTRRSTIPHHTSSQVSNPSSIGSSHYPARQSSPLVSKTGSQTRRHPRSADALDALSKLPRSDTSHFPNLKAIPNGGRNARLDSVDNKGKGPVLGDAGVEDVGEPGVFSDEYELSRDDPRIMLEVQRALKLKARREARIQSGQSSSPKNPASRSEIASGSSMSSNSSSHRILFPTVSPDNGPLAVINDGTEAEVDFRPSTGVSSSTTPVHPIPTSFNNGATLDWSGAPSNDGKGERRWTLSITKRKDKDRPLIADGSIVEKQTSLYARRLFQIKAQARPSTLRKAEITSDQLRRRYNILNESFMSQSGLLNLVAIAQWYGSREHDLKISLEKAEPFTWLKHLEKSGTTASNRLSWHLSALVVEEYAFYHGISAPIRLADSSPLPLPPEIASRHHRHAMSLSSLDSELSRARDLEGQVSFEPIVDLARTSPDLLHRQSPEGPSRHRNHRSSLPVRADSGRDSLRSLFSLSSRENPARVPSPASSLLQVHDLTKLVRRRNHQGSDDGRNSTSERSGDERTRDPKDSLHIVSSDVPSDRKLSGGESGIKFVLSGDSSENKDVQRTDLTRRVSEGNAANVNPLSRSLDSGHRVQGRRRVKTSLPPTDQDAFRAKLMLQMEADEEKISREYEVKSHLLDDSIAHNNRIRQLLNRISSGVRDYDALSKSLGLAYRHLPPELLDAFTFDPSIVSGATRRSQGWKAVEETHHRLIQQREAFRAFLSSSANTSRSPPGSLLHDPIASLLQSLNELEERKEEIAIKIQSVAIALENIQAVHAVVKKEYNATLSHTAAVYPELSDIVALEESYKDQYQQIWEFGLDALTLLLDTVTPFWRHYGKTIGEDVQDFLVIPLYRNEFTGEHKRYSITKFPRRSIRHWVGLFLFFVMAAAVTWLQTRAAITSILHFRLRWITHTGVRWLAMPFFFIGIIIQCTAVFTELCIVVAQLGVVTWWIGWSIKVFE